MSAPLKRRAALPSPPAGRGSGNAIVGRTDRGGICDRTAAMIVRSLDEALAPITDGCLLAVPRDVSGVAMAATRALIRRGVKRLHLVALPTSSLQADLLIGAGCVETLETSAVSLGEFGPAPRFTAAMTGGRASQVKDATCPALHAAFQAAEKGVPFMPLRGLIGSDLLAHRPDWKVVDNPFDDDDPIVLLPAIKPDVALFHAPLADRDGNVWIGRDRELATMAHAAAKTVVTVEKLHDGNLFDDPWLAAGALGGFYLEAVAVAPKGAWPLGLADHYPPDAAHLADYARVARPRKGSRPISTSTCMTSARVISMTLVGAGLTKEESGLLEEAHRSERRAARQQHRRTDRRRAPCRRRRRRRRSRRPRRCWRASAAAGGPTSRCSAAGGRTSSPTAGANCSTAPARAASTSSFCPAARSTARAISIWSSIGDLRASEGALPRLVRLGLSLLCGAEGDPVPPRAHAPHAGGEGRFHQRAGSERGQCLSPRRTDRADHQSLPVRVRPRAAALHARERASRPHASPRSSRTPASPSTGARTCRRRRALARGRCASCATAVAPQLAEVYPQFAAKVFGVRQTPDAGRASSAGLGVVPRAGSSPCPGGVARGCHIG